MSYVETEKDVWEGENAEGEKVVIKRHHTGRTGYRYTVRVGRRGIVEQFKNLPDAKKAAEK